jgi:Ca2+/Na+ antiporter
MIAFLRLAVFGFIGLSVLYLLLSIYSRSVRRETLEKTWDAENGPGGDAAARDAYIEAGMRDYEKSLRKKLIWLVYVIPMIVIGVTVYLVNYQ